VNEKVQFDKMREKCFESDGCEIADDLYAELVTSAGLPHSLFPGL